MSGLPSLSGRGNLRHPSDGFAECVVRNPGEERDIGERSIPVVVKKIVLESIIRHEDVGESIVVVIGEC